VSFIGAVEGAIFAGAVGLAAYQAHVLTRDGALAAFAVGTIVFGIGGWPGAAVLFAFFLTSAALSRAGRARKRSLIDAGKPGARDAWQVLANGGVAAGCMLLAPWAGAPMAAAFAGAFAAAAADTWATEIGTLSRQAPRSIVTFAPVPTGLSGGVTLLGTAATIAGAAFVGAIAQACAVGPFLAVAAGGVAGAFADSFLGATLQALRYCPQCGRACETNPHACGSPTVLRRGAGWIENDAINLAATLAGALVAGGLAAAMRGR